MGYHPFKKSFEHLLCTRYWIRVMKTHKRIRGPCPQSPWSPAGTQTWKQKCSKLLWVMWWSVYQGTVRPKAKKIKLLSRVRLFATPWAVAYHAPPSMGFSRQEYWSRVPLPSPRRSKWCILYPVLGLIHSKFKFNIKMLRALWQRLLFPSDLNLTSLCQLMMAPTYWEKQFLG